MLRVEIAAGPRPARRYARFGVDHHWHLDSRRCTLQVSVRLEDAYRHCETLSRADTRGTAWVDLGVGVAQLDGLLPQLMQPGCRPTSGQLLSGFVAEHPSPNPWDGQPEI